MIYIYALIDPETDKIRYIGQTVQKLNDRLKKHINAKDKSHRTNWIKHLKNINLSPKIILLKICENKIDADNAEIYLIKSYREDGYLLVNQTDGGGGSIGFKHKPESIKKLKMKVISPEQKNHLKQLGVIQWNNTSNEDRLLNIINQKNRKIIQQYDSNDNLINEFISLRMIERELGFFRYNISLNIKGKQSHAYGFIWKIKS